MTFQRNGRHSSRSILVLFLVCYLKITLIYAVADFQKCDAVNEEGVGFFDIKLSKTAVPGQMTTYVCQSLPIPVAYDQEYHAVAFEPLIDNKELVHHMLLFGCGKTYDTSMQLAQARTPHLCGASDNACRFFLVQWSMGIDGQICSPPDAGVRFGRNSISSLSLQIHWNNANSTQGISDSSGFRVYYTRKLRKYDVANLQVGQNDLEIPPGQGHFAQTGSCSAECTSQWLRQPIFLTRAHIHMHYIGVGGVLELVRDGQVVEEIARDTSYEYTSPPAHVLQEPVKVLPGDEVQLTCFFNTRDGDRMRNRTIYWGEGSDGEMCYAFITYYPKVEDFNQCIQFANYDICTSNGLASLGECIYQGFLRSFETGMAPSILKHCGDGSGSDVTQTSHLCSDACRDAIEEVTDHPCMQDRLGKTARRVFLPDLEDWDKVKDLIEQADTHCLPHH